MSNKGRVALIVVVVLVFFLFFSARGIAGFYTDYLWYDALGFAEVFRNILGTRVALAVVFTLVFAVLLTVNLAVADRLAPKTRAPGPEEQFIERYHELVGRRAWTVRIVVSLLLGLVAGVPVSSQWRDWLLFRNAVDFGVDDPLFGVDVGFYVFRLPFLAFVVDWLFAAFVIMLLVTAVAHYLNGGIRLQVQGQRVTPQVKLHLSLLLAVLALLRAASYWLERYELLTSTRGTVDGATYTDVKAQLPAINLLFLISLLAAVLLVINVWQRGWRLPIIAVGLWALVALLAGTAYPAFVQRFQVEPAESTREQPYIVRNIEATRQAMALADVDVQTYRVGDLSADELSQNTDTLRGVRLLDPKVVDATFQRLQGLKGYYKFDDLDVDRYTVPSENGGDPEPQQVVIATRELNLAGLPGNTWENRHLAYTHGFGVALAPAGRVTNEGQPAFVNLAGEAGGFPVLERPEVYFGENLGGYAVVATERDEISFSATDEQESTTRYRGEGGVKLSNRIRRAAFALRFGEWNLFVSNLINQDSRILYLRDVRERVAQLAPFLRFDADPYPVIHQGRVVWVVDGYTTTDRYPYSQRADTEQLPANSGLDTRFNYVRNSVKAVVDAYDGTVTYYVVDESDPIVQAYRKAFPSLFEGNDAVPDELRAHFRYPEDLFRVQTNVWARYHVDDPRTFYQRDDAWNVAQEPPATQAERTTTPGTTPSGQLVPGREFRVAPYYTFLRLPGSEQVQFVMVRPFVPFSDRDARKELAAFMTVSSEPDSYGQLRVFAMANPLPDGPSIVDSNIRQDFAAELTLLDQQGSRVTFGDLQLLPIGDSLVYVRPWFVQATGQTPVPEMRFVTVSYNKRSYRGRTLEEALGEAFPGFDEDLGTVVGGRPLVPSEPDQPEPDQPGPDQPEPGDQSPEELLADAQRLYDEAQEALRAGDLGEYQRKLDEAFQKAAEAASIATGAPIDPGGPPTTTAPSPTTTASA